MHEDWAKVERIVEMFVDGIRSELAARWRQWQIDLMKPELHEVVGALLARQVTLASQLAYSPGTWNAHVAPVLLRAMTDVHITFAWIVKDPLERSRKFILYGLGQQKLILEHRKLRLTGEGNDAAQDPIVKATEAWINSQRFEFLTEVNVGSWSEVSVRDMAEEAGCLELYRYAYTPFSAATHSMWHHVSRMNLQICENPLHRYHKVPIDPDLRPNIDYFYRAAKYVEKSFKLFDQTFSVEPGHPSVFDKLCRELENTGSPSSTGEVESDEEAGQQGERHDS